MLRAAQLWEPLNLPLRLEYYERSRIYVIVSREFSKEKLKMTILEFIKKSSTTSIIEKDSKLIIEPTLWDKCGTTSWHIAEYVKLPLEFVNQIISILECNSGFIVRDMYMGIPYYYYNYI